MKFKEIAKRITGFSTPIFGVSWNPDNTERDIARKVILYLQDRRVLHTPFGMQYTDPTHPIGSADGGVSNPGNRCE